MYIHTCNINTSCFEISQILLSQTVCQDATLWKLNKWKYSVQVAHKFLETGGFHDPPQREKGFVCYEV